MLICMTNIVRMIRIEDGVHNYLHVMLCAWFLFIGIRNLLVGQDKAVYITTMSTGSSSGFSRCNDHCSTAATSSTNVVLTMKWRWPRYLNGKCCSCPGYPILGVCTATQQDDHSTHILDTLVWSRINLETKLFLCISRRVGYVPYLESQSPACSHDQYFGMSSCLRYLCR